MAFDPDAFLAGKSTIDDFDPDAYLATSPTPTPTTVADAGEGDGFLAKINQVLAGQREQAAPYIPEQLSTQEQLGMEEQFSQEHPYIYGVGKALTGVVPKSWEEAKQMVTLPRPSTFESEQLPQSEQLGEAWRGEHGPIEQAAGITGTALQALPLLHLPFAETPLRPSPRDLSLVDQIKQMQQPAAPPEVPPEVAPPAPEPVPPAPEVAPPVPEPPPIQAPPEVPTPPIGTPLNPKPLYGPPGERAADVAAAQQPQVAPAPAPLEPKTSTIRGQEISTGPNVHWQSGGTWDGIVQDIVPKPSGTHDVTVKANTGEIFTLKDAEHYGINAGRSKFITAENQPSYTGWEKDYPDLAAAPAAPPPEAPLPYTPEAAAARAAEPPPPVAEAEKAGTGEGGISIKNEYTDTKRQELGFPEAVQEARRDFGTVWDEAEATDRADPGAKGRLVEAINEGRVKAIDDHGDALLLREQVRAQGERNDAANAVNNALSDTDRTAAKARLEVARDRLQAVYDADRKAGRSTAQGLNARKMLAKEDYSLGQMEARKRAANNGERLNEEQLKDVEVLHSRIDELSKKVDQLEQLRQSRVSAARESRTEAKSAAAAGKRLTDYTGEAAKKARERINRQLHGLGAKPAPPTLLADYAIVGADHLARGLTKFSDWSVQMIKEFGERVRPYLKDLWNRATSIHNDNAKRFQTPQERKLAGYKTRLAKDIAGVTARIQRGAFTKPTREALVLDKAAYKMKANLQRLKNEFERGVAKDAYRKMGKSDKFWQHFVGVERAMKLSSPAVFEKLGLAAAVREVLAPAEAAGGYAAATFFPRLAKGTRYGADLRTLTRAEIKAKASLFSQGMKDAWENIKGKETELEAMSDKYGRQPDFWYNRIGKIHAAIKAPIKRAEFVRSLETRMDAAAKVGEDINHPAVMDRLATESALDANRAIFQQNTVVSKVFAMLDKLHPAAGRTARFLFPVVKIPVNLFKELVTYNVGAPAAAIKIGHAYWKGIETLPPAAREAIIRQLVKGSVGGAAILWGYFNSDRVHDFFKSMPPLFQHTPLAMAIHEGSIMKQLEEQGGGTKYRPTEARKEAAYMAKSDIPFMYTITGAVDALNATDPDGWKKYLYGMIQSSTVPQISSWAAKELDKPTPFSLTEKPPFRPPSNIVEAIQQGIPGLRQNVPIYQPKGHRKH